MAPWLPWACCLRPKVAEHDLSGPEIQITPNPEQDDAREKCIEDSANAHGFAKLRVTTLPATTPEEVEEFASPASSYATCFSEADPVDLASR